MTALFRTVVCTLALLVVFAQRARAHDVMGTVIYVDLGRSRVHLDVEIPVDELRLALGQRSEPGVAELPGSDDELTRYVLSHLKLVTPDDAPFSLEAHAQGVTLHDQRNWLRIAIDGTPPAGGSARDFVLDTDVINHRVVSHHVFVFLRRDVATGQLGEPTYLGTLHYQIHRTRIAREAGSVLVGLWAVVKLGASHIADGSDHLLFLFTLLMPAGLVAGQHRRWQGRRSVGDAAREVLRIVTAFTIGHSLSLLLGGLGVAPLPGVWVESLIAASVLVSALHALVPIFPRREAWVALGFGLVHGLGFASALEGFGVDGSTLALTVFGFNVGVELIQAALVVVSLPWLYLLQGSALGPAFRSVGAGAAFVAALAWLVERAFGLHTAVLRYVDGAFAHGGWMLLGVALLALLVRALEARATLASRITPSGTPVPPQRP